MVGNIGIGIANAIGFRRKNLGGGHISYPGLIAAWSAKGKTNEDTDRNVLKDLTGNGHDITLNGFAFSKNSGYGKYEVDFTTDFREQAKNTLIITKNIAKTTPNYKGGWLMMRTTYSTPSFKVLLTGLSNDGGYVSYTYKKDKDSSYSEFRLKNNEINVLPAHTDDMIAQGFIYYFGKDGYREITLELIPEYPDALVFDGVDDYGVNEDIPQLSDFTIIVTREFPFELLSGNRNFIMSGNKNDIGNEMWYAVERGYAPGRYTISAKKQVEITEYFNPKKSTIFQTKNTYNGIVNIISSTQELSQKGCVFGVCDKERFMSFVFYSAYLFDRSLDEQEIKAFIRKYIDSEYLLPSEIPTPDCYYDFTNGDNSKGEANNVITDLSGNGNGATAHNFAWNEESGYNGGGIEV